MKNKTFTFKTSPGNKNGLQEIKLEGDLGIRNAVDLKSMLDTVKISGDNIIINLREVEKIDVTTIQNLVLFRNIQETNKRTTTVSAVDLDKETGKLLINSGFGKFFKLS
ncbi:MAG TPA: STAS domain-containing protein [Bacteroidales bacterium]|nr:STAS domain-containing protein [Bacteroidales bacterium]